MFPPSASINSISVITSGVELIVKPALANRIPPFLNIKASVSSLTSISTFKKLFNLFRSKKTVLNF